MQKKGLFIVFEGIDGCGKSTQVWNLAKYLFNQNRLATILVTREPYKDIRIREIFKLDEPPEAKAEEITELFLEDRKKHLSELIVPSLEKGNIVILDRYKYSTMAFQSAQGIDLDQLIQMHKDMLVPDITFIIDTPAKTAIERQEKNSKREKDHKVEGKIYFQERVRNIYLNLKKYLPNEKIIIIDGTKSPENVFKDILSEMPQV
jgi:dTMP kinase